MRKKTPSRVAFLFVAALGAALFIWWAQTRPSYLLYQAHSDLDGANNPEVIARYEKILQKGELQPAKEIEYRLALGRFFLNAGGDFGTVVLKGPRSYTTENPYLEKAKLQFEKVLALDPKNAEAYYHQARILMNKGLVRFAEEELKKSHEADARYPQPLILLSSLNLDWGNASVARDLALEALAIDPQNDSAKWALSLAQGQLGRVQEARRAYDDLSISYKNRPGIRARFAFYLLEENRAEEAELELSRAISLNPREMWTRLAKARVFIYKNDPDRAIGELSQAAEYSDYSPWPLVLAAEANWKRGDCRISKTQNNLMREVLPRWPWTFQMAAWTSLCEGNANAALDNLDQALSYAPRFRDALFLKADLLLEMERAGELGRFLRPLLDEKMYEFHALGIAAQSMAAQEKWELAEETALQVLSEDQDNIPALLALGRSRRAKKDLEGAARAFDRALSINEFSGEAAALKGSLLVDKESVQAGENFLKEKITRNPRDPHLLTALGLAFLRSGDAASAVQHFQRAVSAAPWFVQAYVGLADGFSGLGDERAALNAVKDGLQVSSSHSALLERKKQISGRLKS